MKEAVIVSTARTGIGRAYKGDLGAKDDGVRGERRWKKKKTWR